MIVFGRILIHTSNYPQAALLGTSHLLSGGRAVYILSHQNFNDPSGPPSLIRFFFDPPPPRPNAHTIGAKSLYNMLPLLCQTDFNLTCTKKQTTFSYLTGILFILIRPPDLISISIYWHTPSRDILGRSAQHLLVTDRKKAKL